jgi:hypothetical protein
MNDRGCEMEKKERRTGENHAAVINHQRCLLSMI